VKGFNIGGKKLKELLAAHVYDKIKDEKKVHIQATKFSLIYANC
jgi:hypothetical protein